MRVTPPLEIDDSILTSSTVAEPHASETAYSSGATYALGDEVISAATHRTYGSLQAANNNKPLPVPPETETAWWLDIGPSNRWAMFDLYRNTQTVQASPLTVVLTPGVRINTLALLGLVATSVTVSMTSGGSPVYSQTIDLNTREVAGWYDWFFEPFSSRPNLALFDLPPYTNGVITVAITNTGGDVSCGGLVIGSYQYIGKAEANAESDALNFSPIDRDAFGNSTLVPRRSVPKTSQRLFFDKGLVNAICNVRKELNAKPALWSALDDEFTHEFFDAMLILGPYRTFRLRLDEEMCTADLEVEEI